MIWRIPIYNTDIPKPKRVFDVDVDESGTIHRYYTQNIKGSVYVESAAVEKQIGEFLEKEQVNFT